MKILGISGSIDSFSINAKLLHKILDNLPDHQVDFITTEDLNIPLYSQTYQRDIGFPESIVRFKELIRNADLIVICSPEYNSSYSGALKNLIDWCSRTVGDEKSCLAKKVFSLAATSPGALGGLRGLYALRTLIENLGSIVNPTMLAVSSNSELDQNRINKFLDESLSLAEKLRG